MQRRGPLDLFLRVAGISLLLFMFFAGLTIIAFAVIVLANGGSALPTYGISITIIVLGVVATSLTGAGLLHYLKPRTST